MNRRQQTGRSTIDYDPLNPPAGVGPTPDGWDTDPLAPPSGPEETPVAHAETHRVLQPVPARRRRWGWLWRLAGIIIALAALFLLLHLTLFRVRSVRVTGNRTRSASDIVRLAGLSESRGILFLDEQQIARGISQDRYLELESLERHYPSSVVLNVRERVLCANVVSNSVQYLIDENGFVLERLSDGRQKNTLPQVTGMQIRNATLGAYLVPGSPEQLASYRLVMNELLQQGYVNEIEEIRVGDSSHIYLVTNDGFTVDLGWADQEPKAKVAIMRGVLSKLRSMGKTGGSVDITSVEQAVYSP